MIISYLASHSIIILSNWWSLLLSPCLTVYWLNRHRHIIVRYHHLMLQIVKISLLSLLKFCLICFRNLLFNLPSFWNIRFHYQFHLSHLSALMIGWQSIFCFHLRKFGLSLFWKDFLYLTLTQLRCSSTFISVSLFDIQLF